ncbi:segregation and condensation protein A [Candidatus Hydrogenedentota bacterium]
MPILKVSEPHEAHQVTLDSFEGPLDLLLNLIREQEIDIYDIPIARITEQYLEVIEKAEEHDLEIAGEFLIMAAELMRIKSRMLIPVERQEDGDDDEFDDDPRLDLVAKLLEYRRFRDIANALATQEENQLDMFARTFKFNPPTDEDSEEPVNVNLYDLLLAFKNVVAYTTEEVFAEIHGEEETIEEKMESINDIFKSETSKTLMELVSNAKSKLSVIVTFIAILELVRLKRLHVRQGEFAGEIRIFRIDMAPPRHA